MKSFLTNKSGEGYINTALKIVIAVVIGGLILGGFYLLFTEMIFPNTQEKVNDLMDIDSNQVESRISISGGILQLHYSYDGKTWLASKTPNFTSNAKFMDSARLNSKNHVILIADENRLYIVSTLDGGVTWETRNCFIYDFPSGSKAGVRAPDKYYVSLQVNGIYWRSESKDGISWLGWMCDDEL